MNHLRKTWLLTVFVVWGVLGCTQAQEIPSPTTPPTLTPTVTNTPTPRPTFTAVPSVTPAPSKTPVPTNTPPSLSGPLFYVSTEGDDRQGNGSSTQPWGTITHAVNNVPDGATILVRPGLYNGRVNLNGIFEEGIIIRSEIPYQARLRHDDTVILCSLAQGITIEGFDVAHDGPGAQRYVVQIQDFLTDATAGEQSVTRITLRNNILHDSYGTDILKINNSAADILVEGNILYNQGPSGHHIDVNSVTDVIIQDNIFFNDFAASGRTNGQNTGSYVTIQDSNAATDRNLGSRDIILRRNVLLNWQGSPGSTIIAVGESQVSFHQAQQILIENNLILGNGRDPVLAAFGVNGSRDITFRNNTVTGDLPSFSYAVRLNMQTNNLINQKISLYNNIWADYTGTMGQLDANTPLRFSDTDPTETETFVILNNLYWNGGFGLPLNTSQLINYTDDSQRVIGDPYLQERLDDVEPPVWNPNTKRFADGSTFIREAFINLVERYGRISSGSYAIDAAEAEQAAVEDILGRPRTASAPDIGAYELIP